MEGLNELLKLISEKLGVGLDIVTNNFPKYMEEFGKYLMVTKIPQCLLLGFLLAVSFVYLTWLAYELICEQKNTTKKPLLIVTIIFSIILFVFPSISEYTKYKTSPTIYVIEEGIRLLK